jgi:hypothetical protein
LVLRDTTRIPQVLVGIPSLHQIQELEIGGSAPTSNLHLPRIGIIAARLCPQARRLRLFDDGTYYESWDLHQLSGLRALTTMEELKLGFPVPIMPRDFDTIRYAFTALTFVNTTMKLIFTMGC